MNEVDNGSGKTVRSRSGLELWASAEVCEALGWTRARLKLERAGDFPEPVAVVAAGTIAVWDAADVRRWFAANMKDEPSWRRAEAVRMFRQGIHQAEICRQLGAKSDSVRKWLRDAGETLPGSPGRDASA